MTTIAFEVPTFNGGLRITATSGDVLLFTGPNGVGKSALVHAIFRGLGPSISELFPGHRQIHFGSDDTDTVGQTVDALSLTRFTNPEAANRYRDAWSEVHLKSVVRRFVDHENQINREAVSLIRQHTEAHASGSIIATPEEITKKIKFALEQVATNPSLIDTLNKIFETARLDARLVLKEGLLKACRDGHIYGLDRLSDGERAALLLVSAVLGSGLITSS